MSKDTVEEEAGTEAEAAAAGDEPQPADAGHDANNSDSDSDSNGSPGSPVSSLNSEDLRLLGPQAAGSYGLKGIHGRHGAPQRSAIEQILPILKEELRVPGALRQSDRANVKKALKTASENGIRIWGPRQVYKSRANVENAILNLYYASVVAELNEEWIWNLEPRTPRF